MGEQVYETPFVGVTRISPTMYNLGVQQPAETFRINGVKHFTHNNQRVPEPQPAFQTPQPAGRPADYNQQYPPLCVWDSARRDGTSPIRRTKVSLSSTLRRMIMQTGQLISAIISTVTINNREWTTLFA